MPFGIYQYSLLKCTEQASTGTTSVLLRALLDLNRSAPSKTKLGLPICAVLKRCQANKRFIGTVHQPACSTIETSSHHLGGDIGWPLAVQHACFFAASS